MTFLRDLCVLGELCVVNHTHPARAYGVELYERQSDIGLTGAYTSPAQRERSANAVSRERVPPGASAHGGTLSRVPRSKSGVHDLSRFAGEVYECAVFAQTDFGLT
jgi:hypothetical protein